MSKILVPLYILATSSALIFLKLGTKSGAPLSYLDGKLQLNITPFAIGGILLYGFSFLLYMYLISQFELGYIIPLTTAFVYIVIFTASFFIFKETFTTLKVLGIVFILFGIAFLNIKR